MYFGVNHGRWGQHEHMVSTTVLWCLPKPCLVHVLIARSTGTKAQTSCVTGTVFQTFGDQQPILNYQCWPQWNGGNWDATVFTSQPSSTLETTVSSTQTPVDQSSPGPSATPTGFSPSETAVSAQTSSPPTEPKEKSQAWIAGPVIGGIAGAALFTTLGWFLYRRRMQRSSGPDSDFVELESKEIYAHRSEPQNGMFVNQYGPVEAPDRTVYEVAGSHYATPAELDGVGRK
ncbi:hypothetical protein EJ04DRAFT_214138 [Polyplosphaeria fusca]|uniref:Uncharacterized protein n=1 Tax=Polyplosphaeria fusca TaxID=682080 RepID=A0A9P4V3P1_9PLEO|nr:hypothetical protein EJ04DRAFT_214138 [Polyplosphaeria fusca]